MQVLPALTKEERETLPFPDQATSHLRDVCRVFLKTMNGKGAGKVLLDVGAKDNRLWNFFTDSGYKYIATDLNPREPQVLRADMNCLPFENENVSVVFCCHAFEHTTNPLKTLEELARVTRANGLLFIATPAYSDYQLFNCDKTHLFVLTDKQMRRLLESQGIIVERCELWNAEGQPEELASLITIGRVVK